MIPKYLEVDSLDNRINGIVDTTLSPILEDIEVTKISNDSKFVQLRADMDVGTINRKIDTKADK
jgi:hypothetical protein